MRLRSIICLLIAISGVSSLVAANPSYEDRQAADAFKRGNYDEAIRIYTKLIERYPKSAAGYYDRGATYLNKRAYDKAIVDLTKAVQLGPATLKYQSTLALANAGAYNDKGESNKALADANESLRLDPKLGAAYNERGIIYTNTGDYDKAIADFTKAIELNKATLKRSDVAISYFNRGTTYNSKGKYEKAVADFGKAISLDPTNAPFYGNRAIAYFHTRNFTSAVADLNHTLQRDSRDPKSYNDLAWFLATCPQTDLRDGKRAIGYATKACEMTNWKNGDYIDTLAAAYAETGEFEEAVRREKEALALPDMKPKQDEAKARVVLYQARTPYREERRDPPKPAPIISRERR